MELIAVQIGDPELVQVPRSIPLLSKDLRPKRPADIRSNAHV
jgi:hypothetical protein